MVFFKGNLKCVEIKSVDGRTDRQMDGHKAPHNILSDHRKSNSKEGGHALVSIHHAIKCHESLVTTSFKQKLIQDPLKLSSTTPNEDVLSTTDIC